MVKKRSLEPANEREFPAALLKDNRINEARGLYKILLGAIFIKDFNMDLAILVIILHDDRLPVLR
jgi:hypothetical protein